MPSKLPIGWVNTTLGEIVKPGGLRVSPKDYTQLPYIGLEHVESQTMRLLGKGDAAAHRSSSIRFEKGDVLYGKMRPYLNKVWVAEFSGICSAEFLVFPSIEEVESEFLARRLNSADFVKFASRRVSGERPRTDFKRLSSFTILLPPLSEQRRIIALLNAALRRVYASKSATKRGIERLLKYRAAVLHAAIIGELTENWRNAREVEQTGADLLHQLLKVRRTRWQKAQGDHLPDAGKIVSRHHAKRHYPEPERPKSLVGLPRLPDTWIWASADELTEAIRPITYGVIKLGRDVAGGVPILRSSNVRLLRLELEGLKRIDRKIADNYRRTYLKGWEVLITIRGTLGGVVSVPASCAGYNISREVALLALVNSKTSRTVAFFIASDLLQEWMNKRTKGIAYTGINIETLRQLPIPVPPLREQLEISRQIDTRLNAATKLNARLNQQLARVDAMAQSLMQDAFSGRLVPQEPKEEHASTLLERIRNARHEKKQTRIAGNTPAKAQKEEGSKGVNMKEVGPTSTSLRNAWRKIGKKPDPRLLFQEAGFTADQVVKFYELLHGSAEIRQAFEITSSQGRRRRTVAQVESPVQVNGEGSFRLVSLWLENFKNLKDYNFAFRPAHGLDVLLGWNGTGKSNLIEALVIIFRDLHYWWEKNHWPDEPMAGYHLVYEIEKHLVDIEWYPQKMKRPKLRQAALLDEGGVSTFAKVKREDLRLPRFVFGYYSGPTNRLAEHFLPMKRDHYERLRTADSDDPTTLARLLQQRRFFCAETHHAKYVLLAFSYKEDPKITHFLEDRLRIVGFESALFVIRRPRWARKGRTPEDFWGATGIMLRVMEKLRSFAIAPMVITQTVSDGYQSSKEDHYYFFLPNLDSLHAFAAEYSDARSFFLALESTDFSELIHDVKIQVRIKASDNSEIAITFRELSEGEQQLLMVLGLMRFTKSHQSLVLLDEPDTHLNPHWSVDYLKDLASVVSDDDNPSSEQQTSQLLMATHDPLVIASLVKEQVHLLKRDPDSLRCHSQQASQNPRGLGYTGILVSDMFGFRSDLDDETLALLDRQVELAGKPDSLSGAEKNELAALNKQIEALGFTRVSSDPYYRAFIEALNRRRAALTMLQKPAQTSEERKQIREAADEILSELAEKHALEA